MIAIDIKRKNFPVNGNAAPYLTIADFHLTVNPNEFVCLVGSSGCGKTTLLNMIAGLDHDYEGKIDLSPQLRQPKIGYVFQNPRLLPWRTVRENIELAVDSATHADNIDALLELTQLGHFQDYYPQRLSLGMSRRVAIVRAFAVNPDLLLMDEPFVSLDAANAVQVRGLLMALWKQRPHTVLFVTHDLREAIALADRIVFLSAAPMKIVKEIRVSIPRIERDDEQVVDAFRRQLLTEHPELK